MLPLRVEAACTESSESGSACRNSYIVYYVAFSADEGKVSPFDAADRLLNIQRNNNDCIIIMHDRNNTERYALTPSH